MIACMQKNTEELATLESLDNGKAYATALSVDVPMVRQLPPCAEDPQVFLPVEAKNKLASAPPLFSPPHREFMKFNVIPKILMP